MALNKANHKREFLLIKEISTSDSLQMSLIICPTSAVHVRWILQIITNDGISKHSPCDVASLINLKLGLIKFAQYWFVLPDIYCVCRIIGRSLSVGRPEIRSHGQDGEACKTNIVFFAYIKCLNIGVGAISCSDTIYIYSVITIVYIVIVFAIWVFRPTYIIDTYGHG